MLKGLKIEFEPVLKSRRDFFETDGAVQHLGWIATKRINDAKKPSTWGTTTSVVMAFLFVVGISFLVQGLITKLEWHGKTHNAWWVQNVLAEDPKFDTNNNSEYLHNRNYLAKPVLLSFVHDIFGVKTAYAATTWEGDFQSITHNVINIDPGKAITLEAKVKNTGINYWINSGMREVSLRAVSSPSVFRHAFWASANKPATLLENRVNPDELGTFRFAIQAPSTLGTYTENFSIVVNDVGPLVENISITLNVGGIIKSIKTSEPVSNINIEEQIVDGSLPVLVIPEVEEPEIIENVQDDTVEELPDIKNTSEENIDEEKILSEEEYNVSEEESVPLVEEVVTPNIIMNEPTVRVGLYEAGEFVILASSNDYIVESVENEKGVLIPAETRAAVSFDTVSKKFLATAGRINVFSKTIRFKPADDTSQLTLLNFNNPVKWDPTLNDNRFRGTIEISYSDKTESIWVINELALEGYLKGITETSEVSPLEYHKSIAVAARSYALWQMNDGSRHRGKGFDVDASLDQVYRGFNSELRLPTFIQAVEETEGVVVTHDSEIALTTYFAQSDGRTRNYEEVWGGIPLPYLRSVPDPTNDGLRLFGHGVGLSARGALIQASRFKKTFDEIINYYYTDVELEKRYDNDNTTSAAD